MIESPVVTIPPGRYHVIQIGIGPIPNDLDPNDPLLNVAVDTLKAGVCDLVEGLDGVTISEFVSDPAGQHRCLVDVVALHTARPDGSCECGPIPPGQSHAEHVAATYVASAYAHAAM